MDSADELVQEGIRVAAMGGHAEAVALFTKAAEMEPRNETAWLWLAELTDEGFINVRGESRGPGLIKLRSGPCPGKSVSSTTPLVASRPVAIRTPQALGEGDHLPIG